LPALLARRSLCYPAAVPSNASRRVLALGSSLFALGVAAPAWADSSAWVGLSGGALGWKQSETALGANGTMTIDVGVGTSPDAFLVVGAFARLQPIFGHGTDLALLARVATHGFQAGDFGLALDAGGYLRTWGEHSQGFVGGLTLGVPLGFQLSLQGMVGTDQAVGFGAVAGVDLLRLTIYRQTLLDHWSNPSPAWHKKSALGPLGLLFF
jgi:hypothetical protein